MVRPNLVRANELHGKQLLAEAGLHGNPLASLGAAAGNHLLAALGHHAREKAMLFDSLAPVGLECTLGHERYLLLTLVNASVNGVKANDEYK